MICVGCNDKDTKTRLMNTSLDKNLEFYDSEYYTYQYKTESYDFGQYQSNGTGEKRDIERGFMYNESIIEPHSIDCNSSRRDRVSASHEPLGFINMKKNKGIRLSVFS